MNPAAFEQHPEPASLVLGGIGSLGMLGLIRAVRSVTIIAACGFLRSCRAKPQAMGSYIKI